MFEGKSALPLIENEKIGLMTHLLSFKLNNFNRAHHR